MKNLGVVFGGVSSLFVMACGSAPPPDPGTSGPTITQNCSSANQNGYGVCYPTQNIGTGVRSGLLTNSIPGSIIENYAFTGFMATDTTQLNTTTGTTKVIHLADFYDPQQKGVKGILDDAQGNPIPIKVIHVSVAGLWCEYCQQETDFMTGSNHWGTNTSTPPASWATELAPLGVVFVQAIDDGITVGTGATIADLKTWIGWHTSDVTTMLDPGNANLGVFFNGSGIPFNADIDARTMEILDAEDGFDSHTDVTIQQTLLPLVDKLAQGQ